MNVFRRFARAVLADSSTSRKAAIAALAVWGAALIAPEFARVFVDYGTLGFEANNDGRITQVAGPPASTAGLQAGDCIDLRHTPFHDLSAVFGSMGGTTYVRPRLAVTLRIANDGCEDVAARARPYALEAVPAPRSETYRVLLAIDQLAGLLFIVLAALLVWQRPSTMTWGFFLYAIWFNPGQWFVAYAELQRNAWLLVTQQVLQAAAEALGYAGFVAFALRFPNDRVDPRWRPVERRLPWLVLLLFALQLAGYGAEMGIRSEALGRAFYYAGYAIDIAVLLILRARRRTQSPEDRQRTRWVHWGCRIGLIAFIFADSNMATSAWQPLWSALCPEKGSTLFCAEGDISETVLLGCYLLNFTVALAVFHAVRHHRVIDVRFAFGRAATLFLTSLLLAALLAFASTAIEHHLQAYLAGIGREGTQSVETTLLGLPPYILAVALLKLTFDFIHEWLNKGCDRLFFRHLHTTEQHFVALRASLQTARTPGEVDTALTLGAAHALGASSAALVRKQGDGTYLRTAPAEGWDAVPPLPLDIGARVLDKLGRRHRPIRAADILSGDVPAGAGHPIVAAPVERAVGDPLATIAVYGAHVAGDELNDEELDMLQALCAEAARAYDRIELLTLRQQSDLAADRTPSAARPRQGPGTVD